LILGTPLLGIIDVSSMSGGSASVTLLFEVTLAVVLFSDATTISSSDWRKDTSIPGRLLSIGLPLTILFGTIMAALLFTDLGIWEAAVIGAILAPTDASLGQAVISNPRVPLRIRLALNVESGLNDGIVVPVALVFLAAAEESELGGSVGGLLAFIGQEVVVAVVVGAAVGWLGGRALVHATRRDWMSPMWLQIGSLALAAAAYGLAIPLGGSGFIAAWLTGLVLGITTRDELEEFSGFAEALGATLTMASYLVFGAVLLGPAVDRLTWQIALAAVLSLTLVRMVPVAIALVGSDVRERSVLFLGWFGPRGLATIILAGVVIEDAAIAGAETIVTVAMITVGLSVFAHGVTAWHGSESYADWVEETQPAIADEADGTDPDLNVPGRFQSPGM
jgi:NhaP-type Na+/H+ or K+/H+ antiporter